MKVPEELIDEIFSHLPPDDKRSLHSCSLVSKSWLQPSRRVLFAHVSIGVDTYQSWLDKILPTNTELLRHVRSLTYLVRQAGGSYLRVDALRDYLPSFCQLQILTFKAVKIPSIPGHLELFPAFKHSLSSLSIVVSSIRWCAFVALLGSFPHLKNLEIHWQYFQVDDEPTPQIPHILGGRLLVEPFRSKHMSPFVDRFPELRQEYEELVVVGELDPRLVVAVQANLKYLKIDRCGPENTPDLSCCPELRQLEIASSYPLEGEQTLVSSITSVNLRKIVFKHPNSRNLRYLLSEPAWGLFDDVICELVDRLQEQGLEHTLELEVRVEFTEFGDERLQQEFLSKFKEKGRVRMVSVLDGGVREWP